MSEHRDKHNQVQMTKGNLFVRKMTATDFVLSPIEKKTLLKTPAIYPFFEVLPRAFLASDHNDFVMAFDHTSTTQESSHDFNHLELTIFTILVDLKVDAPPGENVELPFFGEHSSTVYVRSDRRPAINTLMN